MPRLVAMAPSGETYISFTPDRGYWLHVPVGARGAGPINESMVEQAVALHGFERLGVDVGTWEELKQAVEEHTTPPPEIEDATFDAVDVREMLHVARQWAAEGEGDRARRLVVELLKVPTVRSDDHLYDAVVAMLGSLDGAEPVVGLRLSGVPENAEARQRFRDLVPAA